MNAQLIYGFNLGLVGTFNTNQEVFKTRDIRTGEVIPEKTGIYRTLNFCPTLPSTGRSVPKGPHIVCDNSGQDGSYSGHLTCPSSHKIKSCVVKILREMDHDQPFHCLHVFIVAGQSGPHPYHKLLNNLPTRLWDIRLDQLALFMVFLGARIPVWDELSSSEGHRRILTMTPPKEVKEVTRAFELLVNNSVSDHHGPAYHLIPA